MGREAFLKRVWEWKEESGGTISRQLRRLGASCDWSRERFTMDEGLSRAVLKVFVQLYREGLIYKDKRLVNWDPKLLTAISDLEVRADGDQGPSLALQISDRGHRASISPSPRRGPRPCWATRPWRSIPRMSATSSWSARMSCCRWSGALIPIIADEYSDPEKGTGAVKITPAHDFNDFEVGKRHDLRLINILDQFGKMLLADNDDFLSGAEVPPATLALHGLDRFEARKRIVAMLEEQGLVDKIEPHVHQVPHGDRSDVVIEPWLTEQWYVDAKTLAEPAIAAVEKGETVFVPKNWEKTYFEWMRNIQPWCISRQLWWGHQIPAWYGPDGKIFVEENRRPGAGRGAAPLRHA